MMKTSVRMSIHLTSPSFIVACEAEWPHMRGAMVYLMDCLAYKMTVCNV